MGIEPYQVTSSVAAVLKQRLVQEGITTADKVGQSVIKIRSKMQEQNYG